MEISQAIQHDIGSMVEVEPASNPRLRDTDQPCQFHRDDSNESSNNNNSCPQPLARDDGRILSWGCGEFGQHGHGHRRNISAGDSRMSYFYEQTGELSRAKLFACGASHTVVVNDSDEVYAWGNGNSGQLGCGDKDMHLNPQRVCLPPESKASPVKGIACGSRHSTLWLENGESYSWGNNFYAQLGYDFRIENYKDNQVLPHLIRPFFRACVKQVACGEKHTLFLYDTGVVAACGGNSFGQLGSGDRAEVVSPKALESPDGVLTISCGGNHSMAVTEKGELFVWGLGRPCGQRRVDVLRPLHVTTHQGNVVAAAGGSAHTAALTANGTVYTFGGGTEGQLGHGSKVLYLKDSKAIPHDVLPRVSQICCGDSYTAAITANGYLYMWGKSSHVIPSAGDLNPSSKHPTPQPIFPEGTRVAQVACGSWHAMAIIGTPAWKPGNEDSGDEGDGEEVEKGAEPPDDAEEDDIDCLTNIGSENQRLHSKDVSSPPVDICQQSFKHILDRWTETHHQTRYSVRREATKLTLEEFYAPTPTPTPNLPPSPIPTRPLSSIPNVPSSPIHTLPLSPFPTLPPSPSTTNLDRFLNVGGEEPSSLPGPVAMMDLAGVELQEEEFILDRMAKPEPLIVPAPATTPVEVFALHGDVERSREKSKNTPVDMPARNSQQHRPEPRLPEPRLPEPRLPEPRLPEPRRPEPRRPEPRRPEPRLGVRSKTMPVVNRRQVRIMPANMTTTFDWSQSPKLDGRGEAVRPRFVINKHVSVQMGRIGSGDDKRNMMTQTNISPQMPKYNRAKTFYEEMGHGRNTDVEPSISEFFSKVPPAPPHGATATGNTRLPRRGGQLEKLPKPVDRSPVRGKGSLDGARARREVPRKSGLSGKLVFSPASSRRLRRRDGDLL